MRINSVEIKSFKTIKNIRIEFQEKIHFVRCEKEEQEKDILEALAIGLGGYIVGIPDIITRNFSRDDVQRNVEGSGRESTGAGQRVTEVVLSAMLDNKEYKWIRCRSSNKGGRTTTKSRDICNKAEKMCLESSTEYPVIVYIGENRTWKLSDRRVVERFKTKYCRTTGYKRTLLNTNDISLLLGWCEKMEMVEWQKQSKIVEYEAMKHAVSRFMSYINPDKVIEIVYDRQLGELMYKESNRISRISELSMEYQSLLFIACEIAYRMAMLNPNQREQITSARGIVLIEEVDKYLSPKSYTKVIKALKEMFPNLQFIVTNQSTTMENVVEKLILAEDDVRRGNILDSDESLGAIREKYNL